MKLSISFGIATALFALLAVVVFFIPDTRSYTLEILLGLIIGMLFTSTLMSKAEGD